MGVTTSGTGRHRAPGPPDRFAPGEVAEQWVVIGACGIAFVVLAMLGWGSWQDTEALLARGVVVTGTVTDIDYYKGAQDSITVEYQVDGQRITEDTSNFDADHTIGGPVEVVYDPADPYVMEAADWGTDHFSAYAWWAAAGAALVPMGRSVLLLLLWVRRWGGTVPEDPTVSRSDYVIDDAGWDDQARAAAIRQALNLIAPSVVKAETDIPWSNREEWPPEPLDAARLLRHRYVSSARQDEEYLQTGVQAVDESTRQAFVTFAPFAYYCALWGDVGELASVNDEGASLVVSLTPAEANHLRAALGQDRVLSLKQWRRRHPSLVTRLLRALRGGG